jgi:hypothetical protein
MFGVDVADFQDWHSPAETCGNIHCDQRVGGGEADAKIFTGLSANVTWMAVACKWVSHGMSTEWWTIPRRTRMAVPPPIVGLSVR